MSFYDFIEAAEYGGKRGLRVVQRYIATNTVEAISAPYGSGRYCGDTALILASAKGHIDIVNALLAAGAKTGHSNGTGSTALHFAVFNDQEDVVAALLTKMSLAEIKHKNSGKRTALQEAEGRHYDEVAQLIRARISALEGNVEGQAARPQADPVSLVSPAVSHASSSSSSSAKLEEKAALPQVAPTPRVSPVAPLNVDQFIGEIPPEYLCSYGHTIMSRPIVVGTGEAYEYENLKRLFDARDEDAQEKLGEGQALQKSEKDTIKCVVTGEPIYRYELKSQPYFGLMSLIEKFVIEQRNMIKDQAKNAAPNALAAQQVSARSSGKEEKEHAPEPQQPAAISLPPAAAASAAPAISRKQQDANRRFDFWVSKQQKSKNSDPTPASSSRASI
jgi:hypothetical protein